MSVAERRRSHRITLIPGDRAGEEVAEQVMKLFQAAGIAVQWERFGEDDVLGSLPGTPLSPKLIHSIQENRVALKGRIAAARSASYESPNVQLRKQLNLFASIRPVRNIKGLSCRYDGVDLVVIRENTEDIYAGIEHQVVPGVVQSLKVVTREASLRIARLAFLFAKEQGRKSVTCVHKANIMKQADGLFLDCCREVAREHPEIEYKEAIADAACMQLVANPYAFDVLVMGNLYGDIISDICAGLVGGVGTVPGVNVGEEITVFEAIHGLPPEAEKEGYANPLPLLIPAIHMLRHLEEYSAADRILSGLEAILGAGGPLTPDLGGAAATSEMIEAVIGHMPAAGMQEAEGEAHG